MLDIRLKILESEKEISQRILEEIKIQLDKALVKARGPIEVYLQDRVFARLQSEPEYDSLINGQLLADFGLYANQARQQIDGIVTRLSNEVKVYVNPIKYGSYKILQGGYEVELFSGNYSDIITWGDAVTDDLKRDYTLPWLNWLLLQGGQIIVRDYTVIYNFANFRVKASRSRQGLMHPAKKGWRVPSQYQGTVKNNWITRSMRDIDFEIEQIIEQELKKQL